MAIYVDELQEWHNGQWCHMWSSIGSNIELDAFAQSIGLKLSWAQHGGMAKQFYHYDLRPSKRALALKKGAVEYSLSQFIREQLQHQRLFEI